MKKIFLRPTLEKFFLHYASGFIFEFVIRFHENLREKEAEKLHQIAEILKELETEF